MTLPPIKQDKDATALEPNFSAGLTSVPPQSRPLISIIVAVYNNAVTLQRCIDSVASQSYPHKELVIIDGGSTDGTVEIIKRNSDKIDCWVSEPDRGIYHAFNKGLDRTKGDWIYFLGSDDYLWDNYTLSRVSEQLINIVDINCESRLVYGKVARVSPQGDVLEIVNQPWSQVQRSFLQLSSICHQGVFHKRTLFEVHGQFDESFSIAGDYELLLRELKNKDSSPIFLPELIIAGMQLLGVSSCPKSRILTLREIAEARSKNNLVVLLPLKWLFSYVKAIIWLVLLSTLPDKLTIYIADFYRNLTGRASVWNKTKLYK